MCQRLFIYLFCCAVSSLPCTSFLQLWQVGAPLLLGCRLSCLAACGILPDQTLNPCFLHWQADSSPLDHQGVHARDS